MRKWDEGPARPRREEVKATSTRLRPRGPLSPLLLLLLVVGLGAAGFWVLSPSQAMAPRLLVEGPIVDAETGLPLEADVYLDGRLLYTDVRSVSVRVPSGSELRIVAKGYAPWAFRFRYELRGSYRFHGPIRLQKKGSKAGEE